MRPELAQIRLRNVRYRAFSGPVLRPEAVRRGPKEATPAGTVPVLPIVTYCDAARFTYAKPFAWS